MVPLDSYDIRWWLATSNTNNITNLSLVLVFTLLLMRTGTEGRLVAPERYSSRSSRTCPVGQDERHPEVLLPYR